MSEPPMARDRLGAVLAEPTVRRLFALASFAALLIFFRHLLLLLVFFVTAERLLGWPTETLARRTGMGRKVCLGIVTLGLLILVGGAAVFGVDRAIQAGLAARNELPDRIAAFRQSELFLTVQAHLQDAADKILEQAQHYAGGALQAASAFGRGVLYALIGFILALVFQLEREELQAFGARVSPQSLLGTLLRWFGYLAEAMLITVQFQLVVAACNAVLTLPVLLIVGIPHAPQLALFIFVSGLVPVIGNVVAGGILSLLAYQVRGWLGVGLFVGLTFVLHKLESYYLSPRLAARHVRAPGFVLVVSLILWEHAAGFVGLFVSFPCLYVAQRIAEDLRGTAPSERGPTPLPG